MLFFETSIMKFQYIFFILILSYNYSIAECSNNGIRYFPEQKEISINPMFIIQGYAESQKSIRKFQNTKVYLISEKGEQIELVLQELLEGDFHLTQAVFKPLEMLRPSTTYFLKINNRKRDKFWITNKKLFSASIDTNLDISYSKNEIILYGCGPATNAIFKVSKPSKKEIWYKTEVIEIATNKKTTFFITARNQILKVGHGMCSGAFSFNRNGKYKVRFTPTNIDGKTLKTTSWVTFDSPYIGAKNPYGF